MPIRTLLPVLSLALFAGAAGAGTLLETVNRDLSRDGGSTIIHTWAQNGMMRVESQADKANARSTMIFKEDTIYAINHQEKSYYAMDRESMKRVADQLNPALKMLQERMKDMTPEQRAQMEKMMGGRLPRAWAKPKRKPRSSALLAPTRSAATAAAICRCSKTAR